MDLSSIQMAQSSLIVEYPIIQMSSEYLTT